MATDRRRRGENRLVLNPIQGDVSPMADTDHSEVLRENWRGICRECGWERTAIGSVQVIVEARTHLNSEEDEHVVDVYRDDDLMEIVDTAFGGQGEYLVQDAPPLREREGEHERIAREVADPDSEVID
jgi:SepF-like predicted cell division protein (DUF552 family)